MKAAEALREHWPEYLIEGWALGMFMVSAGLVATALEAPQSPLHGALAGEPGLRRVLAGVAMGGTAMALIHSPWGRRSGAHMNPAVTLSFWLLGKVRGADALGYAAAQFVGGTLGVLLVAALLGMPFTAPPVDHALTLPGPPGPAVAFVAEFAISAVMMTMILAVTRSASLAPYAGLCAGALVALWISIEAPLSGMSMNPARSFASAYPAGHFEHLGIYFTAPTLGMTTAALLDRVRRRVRSPGCAKLLHPIDVRCIHCGHRPQPVDAAHPHATRQESLG
jgi:aquaporin Z